jgi:anti-sigma factor RsiW
MTCKEFLETHSEYMDGVLAPAEATQCRAHLDGCAGCARYDRVVRKGVQLLTGLPPLEPTADLVQKVHRRTAAIEREPRMDGLTWAVSVAAVLALLAWSPLLRNVFETEAVPPSAATISGQSSQTAHMLPDYPVHTAVRFGYAQAPWAWQGVSHAEAQGVEVLASGPYSPLTVDPPAYHAAPPPVRVEWMALRPDD